MLAKHVHGLFADGPPDHTCLTEAAASNTAAVDLKRDLILNDLDKRENQFRRERRFVEILDDPLFDLRGDIVINGRDGSQRAVLVIGRLVERGNVHALDLRRRLQKRLLMVAVFLVLAVKRHHLKVDFLAFAQEGKWHDIEVEDDVTAYLEFEGGATGVFIASTGDLPGTNRLEVSFDRGKIVCENGQLLRWMIPGSEAADFRTGSNAYPHPDVQPEVLATDGENPQHIGVINAFAAHVLHGAPLIAEGEEGINALMISNAMHLSSWLGQPVTTPIDEALFASMLAERAKHSRHKNTRDVTFVTDHSATGRAL